MRVPVGPRFGGKEHAIDRYRTRSVEHRLLPNIAGEVTLPILSQLHVTSGDYLHIRRFVAPSSIGWLRLARTPHSATPSSRAFATERNRSDRSIDSALAIIVERRFVLQPTLFKGVARGKEKSPQAQLPAQEDAGRLP